MEAKLWFNSYFGGSVSRRVDVVGETPKRFRVRLLEDIKGRGWKSGEEKLVPKHAIEFPHDSGAGVSNEGKIQ